MSNWEELQEQAEKRDFDVIIFKKNFGDMTMVDVEALKVKIKEEHDIYMSKGPGTSQVSLEEGAELLIQSKEKVKQFNRKREEEVLRQKLFGLEISKFPELIAMDELNKKYDLIYQIYKEY
jgi:dynein heavy chain